MHLGQIDPQLIANDCDGLVIGGDLKIGGQKRVWRCAYKERAYVLKVLLSDEATRRRLKRELEVMRICNSPYLPKLGPLPLRELDLHGETVLYFLEEYIEGLPLNSVYKPMAWEEVADLAICILSALEVLAGNGYLHRDVKPMNIIQKTVSHYVLIDAGYALDYHAEAITASGSVVGTRPYLSPDQVLMPQKQLDVRSDLFALGITLYECSSGVHPFLNDEMPRGDVVHTIMNLECLPPRQFNDEIPLALQQIILRLLQKRREDRYASLTELKSALRLVLQDRRSTKTEDAGLRVNRIANAEPEVPVS